MELKQLSNDEIKKLILEKKISIADIVDAGICPTCFDKENNNILYGKKEDKMIYEDDDFECFLVGNPRANGHIAISTKTHYKDMMEINDEICTKIFLLAKRIMNLTKKIYEAESVYLCTMCDGPMNHFHIQLIPRYSFEKRGSKNFIKPRFEYVEDKEKINKLREKLNYNISK
jgi:histidine triad (HIT) family protein